MSRTTNRWLAGGLSALSAALLLGSCALCGGSFFLGAYFFPIGPEGLSARDLAVRQLTDLMTVGGFGALCAGVVMLLLAAVALVVARRQQPTGG